MYLYIKTQKKSCFTSLLLHLLIFAAIGGYFKFLPPPNVQQGEHDAKIITSYLYKNHQLKTVLQKPPVSNKQLPDLVKKPQPLQQTTIIKNDLPLKKNGDLRIKPTKQTAPSSEVQMQSSSSGEQAKGLLALLHAAIQSKQQYPSNALQMRRQGRVTIAFNLAPSGAISHLQLLKSSGSSSLDDAALAAVRLAAPFKGVDVYLKAAQDFSIDVVFALDDENE